LAEEILNRAVENGDALTANFDKEQNKIVFEIKKASKSAV